jgi:hypothetical protein
MKAGFFSVAEKNISFFRGFRREGTGPGPLVMKKVIKMMALQQMESQKNLSVELCHENQHIDNSFIYL